MTYFGGNKLNFTNSLKSQYKSDQYDYNWRCENAKSNSDYIRKDGKSLNICQAPVERY